MRASGVLMHISSLPGETGIGTLGKEAYKFVDFLKYYHIKIPISRSCSIANPATGRINNALLVL